jgi:hypothetical protein
MTTENFGQTKQEINEKGQLDQMYEDEDCNRIDVSYKRSETMEMSNRQRL